MPALMARDLERPVFLHPGQGTQRVGMGRWMFGHSAVARDILAHVSSFVGGDLGRIIARGPSSVLDDTRHAQPAIFATNLAAEAVLRDHGVRPAAVAGHSSGEMSALVTAGVLDLGTAAGLVALRSSLMAGVRAAGAMGAVFGLPTAVVEGLCAATSSGEPLVIAIENAPRQVVISGAADAVARCLSAAREAGAVRSRLLRTSNAFHSPLMSPCCAEWAAAVAAVEFHPPEIPLLLGSRGAAVDHPDGIREAVVAQLTDRVLWADLMAELRALRPSAFVECGASRFLVSLVRAEDRMTPTLTMEDERIRTVIGASA